MQEILEIYGKIQNDEGHQVDFITLVLDVQSNDEMVAREKPQSYSGSHWWRVSGQENHV
jgi:hypothetical protein